MRFSAIIQYLPTGCTFVTILFACMQTLVAQDIDTIEPPLIDQQPFDLITLTDEEGGESVKVLPLVFPDRQVPTNFKPTDKLEVVLVRFQERRYEITWRAIAKIDIYEQRIYDEAIQKMKEKDFVTAFQNLSFLLRNYPKMPKLQSLRQEFVFQSAIDRFAKGELRQTLSALEELRDSAPGYKANDVNIALSNVAGRLIAGYEQNGQLGAAQSLLDRLSDKYGTTLPVVQEWNKRIVAQAIAKRDEAERFLGEKKYREARKAAIELLSLSQDKESQDLFDRINRARPTVRVGVMQRSTNLNPSSLIDWPARRAGALTYKSLFQFLETGAEGGRYGFALGTFRLSDDRQELVMSLDPNIQDSLRTFELAQELLQRAEPGRPNYDPSWAAIVKAVSTNASNQVVVQLKQPNVLPHALLQWTLPDSPELPGSLPGDYMLSLTDSEENVFVRRDSVIATGQPVEVLEIFYDDPKLAVNDLLRGEIDVLDQLYPADAKRLENNTRLRIGAYALPTTHMLIPVSDHVYLAKDKFRRALLYATNRQSMLTGELLNSSNLADGRLISGPFPIGDGESDPLAYAYDPAIKPVPHNPNLAKLLLVMTSQGFQEAALKSKKPSPELETLIVGCPNFEFARVAVQAMIQQWMNVGIKAEMKILAPGSIEEDHGCDLLYVIANMWEPATDIERLLGGNGIAASDNPFIVQALERLRKARNWREVRTAMQDLHQLVDYHLPVLPLWQITDRFAVSQNLEGLQDRPVSLYQDIANWRVNLGLKTVRR